MRNYLRTLSVLTTITLLSLVTGCGHLTYTGRPTTVVVAQVPPPNIYVAQTESDSDGSGKYKPVQMNIGTNGTVLVIGKVYNYLGVPVSLLVSSLRVCEGSELQTTRPETNDDCWAKIGKMDYILIKPQGRSPWLRVPATGGFYPFVYDRSVAPNRVERHVVQWPLDFWTQDYVCPGNELVDWVLEIGHTDDQRVCRSTLYLR